MKILTFTLLLLHSFFLFSQKKKINRATYEEWKYINNVQQSRSGACIAYEIAPYEKDGVLWIKTLLNSTKINVPRGKEASFAYDERSIAYFIKPEYDTIRAYKLNKA